MEYQSETKSVEQLTPKSQTPKSQRVKKIAGKIRSGDFSFLAYSIQQQQLEQQRQRNRTASDVVLVSGQIDHYPLPIVNDYEIPHNVDMASLDQYQDETFNVLAVEDKAHLNVIALRMLLDVIGSNHNGLSQIILTEYVRLLSTNYQSLPFHNFYHAVSSLHCMYIMTKRINAVERIGELQVFAFSLAALAHDVGHPGHTNSFEVNSDSTLALLYNDTSVLEQFHCSLAFGLMLKPGAGILEHLKPHQRKEVRKTMIACILATDMTQHDRIVAKGREKIEMLSRRELYDWCDGIYLGELFMHIADLSGPIKEFNVAKEWASLITEEFNAQYTVEVNMGLPALEFMAAADNITFLTNEIKFSSQTVLPLWGIISAIFPSLHFGCAQLEQNISQYVVLKEAAMIKEK